MLIAISVPFSGLIVSGIVLKLGHVCTGAHGSQSTWDWKGSAAIIRRLTVATCLQGTVSSVQARCWHTEMHKAGPSLWSHIDRLQSSQDIMFSPAQ